MTLDHILIQIADGEFVERDWLSYLHIWVREFNGGLPV